MWVSSSVVLRQVACVVFNVYYIVILVHTVVSAPWCFIQSALEPVFYKNNAN